MSYLGLLGESLALYDGVIQLRVGIRQLSMIHKELEALCQSWQGPVPAAQYHDMSLGIPPTFLCADTSSGCAGCQSARMFGWQGKRRVLLGCPPWCPALTLKPGLSWCLLMSHEQTKQA